MGTETDSDSLGSTRFVDPDGVLGPDDRARLSSVVGGFPGEASAEVIVQIVPAVPGRRFREHAMAARREHSRHPERSLILVVSLEDRHAELATAPLWNDRFTAATSHGLLAEHFVPAMRAGDLVQALAGSLAAIGNKLGAATPASASSGPGWWRVDGIFCLVAAVFAYLFPFVRNHTCRECRSWGDYSERVVVAATYVSEGRNESHFRCRKCGADYTEIHSIPVLSSSSDSSWDSGGSSGGSSDGGGGADW